ncbi:DUF4389 domain-containing protein [Ornithinimicrobium sp. LYQ92]|uniref:DUF4389 domain-containing protein n=1 Tax=Serinicoccus sp. LYQ92 TaxID=3378798 RepID=UPI003852EC97
MTSSTPQIAYPLRIDAQLDTELSRWLWLVKWFLAIPHYLILAFLWVAFLTTSVMAFFSILFTGRYPRALFEFNVGVLRWSWRVSYYTYGALGTDRYPPFTLHEVADYPAHLEVDYPQHLSRGLVLIKWWLLALPHLVVVGLFLGGASYVAREGSGEMSGVGLIGILVLVAGVFLLVAGRYPTQLFDLILGLNRWVLRVAAYVGLMTDRYPPFALDQGGQEPGPMRTRPHPVPAAPAALVGHPAGHASARSHQSDWTAGRVVALVIGSVLILCSLGLGAASGTLALVDQGQRDQDGFLMSDAQLFQSSAHAITSSNLQLHTDAPGAFLPGRILGDARLTADPVAAQELFLGIGATTDVQRYLSGVDHDKVTDIRGGEPVFTARTGGAPATAPTDQQFWVAQGSGGGEQSITWPLAAGDWTAVVMNSDGSPAIAADITIGADIPSLTRLFILLAVLAGLCLIAGVVLVTLPLSKVSKAGPR